MSTEDRIRAILLKDYQIDASLLAPDTPLEKLGIDSLGKAELVFTIEDEFKLRMPDAAVELRTVGDLATFIDGLVADAAVKAGSVAAAPEQPQSTL